jgi:anti-sigma B factor antagonist
MQSYRNLPGGRMQLTIDRIQHWSLVTPLEPRLDAKEVPEFKARLKRLVEEGHRNLILDLGKVRFIDSAGLGAIISILKAIDGRGSLVVVNFNEQIAALLQLTGLDTVLETAETAEAFIGANG